MARVSIGVFGAGGRMGRAVTRSIRDDYASDAQVVAEISSDAGHREDLLATDAVIDVSLPAGTERLLDWFDDVEQPPVVVSATTGLSATQFERLAELGSRTTVLHSANFAPGVALLRQMLLSVAPALEQLGYQAVLTDTHHKEKRDAPSGTAKDIARTLNDVEIHSIRAGDVVGRHTLALFGRREQITLTHDVSDRALFADGAAGAAIWLARHQVGHGLLSMDDYLQQRFNLSAPKLPSD